MVSQLSGVATTRGEAPPRMPGLIRAASYGVRQNFVHPSYSKSQFHLRAAVTADLPAITALINSSESRTSSSPGRSALQIEGAASVFGVVAIDVVTGRCAGFVSAELRRFSPAADPSAPHLMNRSAEREGEIHIVDICVGAEFRGRLLEQHLLNEVLSASAERFPKCRSALLFVRRSDVEIRQLAATQRFLVVDCLSKFDGMSACTLAMRRYFHNTSR